MSEARDRIRKIAADHRARGDETAWFEAVYAEADGDRARVAWADGEPNPHVLNLLDEIGAIGAIGAAQREILEVGCGLGDTSEALAALGFKVTAFDLSPTAIAWCRRRFPSSLVDFVTADLFALPPKWEGRFPLVVECYTLQVLTAALREKAVRALTRMLAPGGRLLVVCRARDEAEPEGEIPWPLTMTELHSFANEDLVLESVERFLDREEPPASRFRAVYRRSSARKPAS
ncbi:MAG: class I SAM-dependent methyltransferase [Gemmatimonadetes bacterium]|nr:class I SAM-dependent methyltransferase [Gemmatimonadota bacterium]